MILATTRWSHAAQPLSRILLLHGLGGTGKIWRPLAAGLEGQYDVLAPDQRGHGRSDSGDQYDALTFGNDLYETCHHLQFEPCWVVGHSMGARSAMALAQLHPEMVQGLVLIDIGLAGEAGGSVGRLLRPILHALPMEFLTRAEARDWLNQSIPDPSVAQYLMAVALPHPTQAGGLVFPFDKEAVLRTIDEALGYDITDQLLLFAELGKPIYLLRGAQSKVWTREAFEQDQKPFAQQTNVHFEEWDGTGHGLPFEKRKELMAKLVEWISAAAVS